MLAQTKNFQKDAKSLTLPNEQYSSQYLLDRFLPEAQVQDYLRRVKNESRSFYRGSERVYQSLSEDVASHLLQLPGMSTAENLDLLDSKRCNVNEIYRVISRPFFGLRDRIFITNQTSATQAWYFDSCGPSKGQLFVQTTKDDSATPTVFELPHINHDFAKIPDDESSFATYIRFAGMSDDGQTFLLKNIDDTNFTVSDSSELSDSSSSSLESDLYVIFQSQFTVYREAKIYRLPLQKLVYKNTGNASFAAVSADGDRIALAHARSVKVFDYDKTLDDYVYTGLYQHQGLDVLAYQSLEMSQDGRTLYIDVNSQPHQIELAE